MYFKIHAFHLKFIRGERLDSHRTPYINAVCCTWGKTRLASHALYKRCLLYMGKDSTRIAHLVYSLRAVTPLAAIRCGKPCHISQLELIMVWRGASKKPFTSFYGLFSTAPPPYFCAPWPRMPCLADVAKEHGNKLPCTFATKKGCNKHAIKK